MKNHKLSPRPLAAAAAIAAALLLGACASKGIAPVAELATARSTVAQAESAGATQLAPVELLAAREKLGRAEAALREERFADSRRWAEQASVDAQLAERRSRAVKAVRAVDELKRGNAALEAETQRRP